MNTYIDLVFIRIRTDIDSSFTFAAIMYYDWDHLSGELSGYNAGGPFSGNVSQTFGILMEHWDNGNCINGNERFRDVGIGNI